MPEAARLVTVDATSVTAAGTAANPDPASASAPAQVQDFVLPAGEPLPASTAQSSGAGQRQDLVSSSTAQKGDEAALDDAAAALEGSAYASTEKRGVDQDVMTMVMSKDKVPLWYKQGHTGTPGDIDFEYQSAIGRDGYEPNPVQPNSEYFGPFRIDYLKHTIYLEDWNFNIDTTFDAPGWGNLIVGENQSFKGTFNSAI